MFAGKQLEDSIERQPEYLKEANRYKDDGVIRLPTNDTPSPRNLITEQ